MTAIWTFHRFEDGRWVDTADADADATPGLLLPARPEVEATLTIDGRVAIRDVVWPLAWRLCLEPVRAIRADGATSFTYRCFGAPTVYTLRVDGDLVQLRRNDEPEQAFAAAALWTALIAAGARVEALAARDRGPGDRDVTLLRDARARAEAALGGQVRTIV
ncbi:MAG: hypothetical protein ABMB14_18565 [Myxococcota bacterium]